jgi:hypothetical protein
MGFRRRTDLNFVPYVHAVTNGGQDILRNWSDNISRNGSAHPSIHAIAKLHKFISQRHEIHKSVEVYDLKWHHSCRYICGIVRSSVTIRYCNLAYGGCRITDQFV